MLALTDFVHKGGFHPHPPFLGNIELEMNPTRLYFFR
jgi:hypothetical protein